MSSQPSDPSASAPTAAPKMAVKAVVFVRAVILLGALVTAYSAGELFSGSIPPEWIVLVVLTVVTGLATLRMTSVPISFSISDTFSIVAALLVGPSAGALTAAIDGLVVTFRLKNTRPSATRVLFNMAQAAVATWVAAQVFVALAGPRPLIEGPLGALRLLALLTVFGAVNFGLTTGTVATAIALEKQTPVAAVWRQHFGSLWVTYLGGVFASLLMMALSRASETREPIGTLEVLILIAPLPVILYVTLTQALGRAQDQIAHLGGMNRVYVAAIEALATAIDAKDQVTHDHIRRVQDNSVRLARELGVTDDLQIQALKAASLLHDVGKISVPEHILNKPGRLSPSEFEIMKRHAPVGADILSVIGFPYPVEPIVRHHHENWDGTGYPDKIAGEQIPIGARILQVVDCFDALTSDRPYRPALSDHDALKIIADRRGTMYDPRVVDAFLALHGNSRAESPARSGAPTVDPHAVPPQAPAETASEDTEMRSLEAFYELGVAMAHQLTLEDVGETLWVHLQARLGAQAFVLLAYDEATDSLVSAYRAGEPTLAADSRIPVGDRLSGWVAATRQAIVNSDARLDLDADVRDDSLLRSALAVPICVDDRVAGVLAFYSDRSGAFTDAHHRIAQAAAHVAATRPVHIAAPAVAAVARR